MEANIWSQPQNLPGSFCCADLEYAVKDEIGVRPGSVQDRNDDVRCTAATVAALPRQHEGGRVGKPGFHLKPGFRGLGFRAGGKGVGRRRMTA